MDVIGSSWNHWCQKRTYLFCIWPSFLEEGNGAYVEREQLKGNLYFL